MEKTLENIINGNEKGLFLLDCPTGFGKTTVVVNLIRRFLRGEKIFSKFKRIFFITNLITNLPYDNFINGLTEDERACCFRAKATVDYILERLLKVTITDISVKNSKVYNDLKNEVEAYAFMTKSLEDDENDNQKLHIRKNLNILRNKIANDSEPKFRQYIKDRFFYKKSISERKDFIEKNAWFRFLYPICDIDKYKVIFLTTQKFILPIDTFKRVPFYAYCDEIVDNSLVFIDEFDSTKHYILKQIINDGIKSKIDIVGLFLNLHFALQNFVLPKKLLQVTNYNKKKVESKEWHTASEHFEYWRKKFYEKYLEHQINYLMKSENFSYSKAFLFDDGKYFNIVKDNSVKHIYANINEDEDILSLHGENSNINEKKINSIIRDLEYCIDGFMESLNHISNDLMHYKNSLKSNEETKFTLEESIYTVLDTLNLGESEKDYLFTKILTKDYIFKKPEKDIDMRRGFNFMEIEDSNYHDMKSIIYHYNFPTTPEDILVKLAGKALIVGISATAQIKSCIGNYDLDYLEKKLNSTFLLIPEDDKNRIAQNFNDMQERHRGEYLIHMKIIDDFPVFSDKEKCLEIINQLFINENFEKYNKILQDDGVEPYYFLLELKLACIYKEICEKDIHSLIAFINRFPKVDDKFNIERLKGMFSDLVDQNNYNPIRFAVVNSQLFEEQFKSIKNDLALGQKVFILTTYQTIGTGKNIQYTIPKSLTDSVIYDSDDTTNTKDFDAIYLVTPTNLLQILNHDSADKYSDLANYLFQQEYLYQNKYLPYAQMKFNIANGFRTIFFGEKNACYTKNSDMYLNTLKIGIQAVGRICRCRNKNKNIYLYADKEITEKLYKGYNTAKLDLVNEEFAALIKSNCIELAEIEKMNLYSLQSKKAYYQIKKAAYSVRNSYKNIEEWKELREFVLKNPTTNNPKKFKSLYFEFDAAYSGYSYNQDNKFNIIDMKMDTRYDMQQVSEQACDLPLILSIGFIEKLFDEYGYSKKFKPAKFIMSPSMFKQIYLGALGEVVGRWILAHTLGWDLEELDDVSYYEYFDFKLGNIYFDFKHWNEFRTDNNKYVSKIERKLSRINGAKCFVINLIKRTESKPKINIGDTVVQIPYLIDHENDAINEDAIDYIREIYELSKL